MINIWAARRESALHPLSQRFGEPELSGSTVSSKDRHFPPLFSEKNWSVNTFARHCIYCLLLLRRESVFSNNQKVSQVSLSVSSFKHPDVSESLLVWTGHHSIVDYYYCNVWVTVIWSNKVNSPARGTCHLWKNLSGTRTFFNPH